MSKIHKTTKLMFNYFKRYLIKKTKKMNIFIVKNIYTYIYMCYVYVYKKFNKW
jgi:hypothetical protein